jgi:polyisoprenoid-binding protein YceI
MAKMKVKIIVGMLLTVLFSTSIHSQTANLNNYKGNWDFKSSESEVTFKIGNIFIFNVKGEMPVKSGHFIYNNKLEIKAVIGASYIHTGNNKRDEHLRSEDFFYTEKYPQIEFVSNQVSKNTIDNGYDYQSIGKLKIRGIGKEETVFFNVEKLSESEILITGEAKINRLHYDVDHQMAGMDDLAKVKLEVKAKLKE